MRIPRVDLGKFHQAGHERPILDVGGHVSYLRSQASTAQRTAVAR